MPRPPRGDRPPLSLRTSPELRAKLEAAASRSGRSISQEAEWFLERGTTLSEQTQGALTRSLLSVLEYFLIQIEAEYGEAWQLDDEARTKCHQNLTASINLMVPINLHVSRSAELRDEHVQERRGDFSQKRVKKVLAEQGIQQPRLDDDKS